MSEKLLTFENRFDILVLSVMSVVPMFWIIEDYVPFGPSRLYFACYFTLFLALDVLLNMLDEEKLAGRIPFFVPVLILIVFRDIQLFVNCLTAFILFMFFTFLYFHKKRNVFLMFVSVAFSILCIIKGDMPYNVAVLLAGLIVISISCFKTSQIKYALTIVLIIECIVLAVNLEKSKMIMDNVTEKAQEFAKSVDETVKDAKYRFGNYNGPTYVGYGQPGGMYGKLHDSHKEDLDIEIFGNVNSIYLKGSSFYDIGSDGISGKVEEDCKDNGWFALYLNALYHGDINKSEAACFSKVLSAYVTYKYMRTEDVMRSSNVISMDMTEKGKLGKGDKYNFSYLALDYANPYFDELINETAADFDYGKIADYAVIKDYAFEIYNLHLESIMDERAYYDAISDLKRQSEDQRYTDESFVTDRIRKLTEEITKDSKNDYEKARKIEAYLRGLTYNTEVDLRDKDNYVEAFLFEEKSGYCAHFSSAMVVMLRSIGIPARYTQGYRHIKDDGNIVYSNDAHAWPEAFINGIGWVAFEPTVTYTSAAQSAWGLRTKNTDRDLVTGYEANAKVPDSVLEMKDKEKNTETVVKEDTKDKNDDTFIEVLKRVLSYTFIIIFIVFAIVMLIWFVKTLRYNRMTPREKVFEDMKVLGRKCKKTMKDEGPVTSVFDYIPYVIQKKTAYDLNEMFFDYYKVRFRGDEPEKEFTEKLHNLVRNM